MDPKLVDAYTNKILLNEKKQHSEAKPLGDKGGKLQGKGAAVVKPAKASEFDFEKDVKLTSAFAKTGTSRVKNLKKPQKLSDSYSKFDAIFKRTLMEEVDDATPEELPSDDVGASEPVDQEFAPEGAEGTEESEGDIVSDLQDVVSKLNDILTTLGANEDEDEGEEKEDVNNEIDQVEGPGEGSEPVNEEPASVSESLSDLKGAILKLKTGLNALTSKKNVVSSKLKVTKGKADAGEPAGKPLAKNTSLQSKGNMHVQTKLKPGHGLFEGRRK